MIIDLSVLSIVFVYLPWTEKDILEKTHSIEISFVGMNIAFEPPNKDNEERIFVIIPKKS